MDAKVIAKEELGKLKMVDYDVLDNANAKDQRIAAIEMAMRLGNAEKVKSKIYFEAVDGAYVVDTTIWHVTDSHIDLKGGAIIPIAAIHKVI